MFATYSCTFQTFIYYINLKASLHLELMGLSLISKANIQTDTYSKALWSMDHCSQVIKDPCASGNLSPPLPPSPSAESPGQHKSWNDTQWLTVAHGASIQALAGWVCAAAGKPATLFLACSINSGGSGTDWSLTLISDWGWRSTARRCPHDWLYSGTWSRYSIRTHSELN